MLQKCEADEPHKKLHSSEIAFAVTQRVNNEQMWTDKWLKEKKTREDEGSGAETSPVRPGGSKQNGGGGGEVREKRKKTRLLKRRQMQ